MDYHNEIAKIAYDIFEREGRVHGKHYEHWLEAELIVVNRHHQTNGTEEAEQKECEEAKPKKRVVATRTTTNKSETKPKTAAKTRVKSKTKKTLE